MSLSKVTVSFLPMCRYTRTQDIILVGLIKHCWSTLTLQPEIVSSIVLSEYFQHSFSFYLDNLHVSYHRPPWHAYCCMMAETLSDRQYDLAMDIRQLSLLGSYLRWLQLTMLTTSIPEVVIAYLNQFAPYLMWLVPTWAYSCYSVD